MSVCLCSRTGCIQAHCINARVFYAFSLNVLNEQHLSWRPSRSTKGRFFLLFFLSTIDLNIVSVLSMRHELFRILSLFYTYSLSLSLSLTRFHRVSYMTLFHFVCFPNISSNHSELFCPQFYSLSLSTCSSIRPFSLSLRTHKHCSAFCVVCFDIYIYVYIYIYIKIQKIIYKMIL